MDVKKIIDEVKCFLLDLDGTVYIEGDLIGDMKNTLDKIRKSGRKIVYLTNNSSKTDEEYVKRLTNVGIYTDNDMIYTSGDACISFLNEHYKGKKVYLIGTERLRKTFIDAGITLTEDADIVVLAYDTEINYEKLHIGARLLNNGATYIATHPDINCPAKDTPLPDVGSYIKLFEASTGRVPEKIIGKPYTIMGEEIARKLKLNKNEFVMVGDRLYTDIKFGINNKFHSILVMSGETTAKMRDESEVKAEIVLDSLNDVVKYL